MAKNLFKERLGQKVQYGIWMSTTSSYVAEIVANSNYDWCLIDGEHAPNTLQDIRSQLQAVSSYAVQPVVRVVEGTDANIKQALDIGAQNLLVPMIDTAEQAAQVIKATRYPPAGNRGVGASIARAARWGKIPDYMQTAEDGITLLLQIESKKGLESLDEILKLDGIDGIFIGAADLSASLGHPGNPNHPEVQAAIRTALEKIVAAGIPPGYLATNVETAKAVIGLGVKFIAVGVDASLLLGALDERLSHFKDDVRVSVSGSTY